MTHGHRKTFGESTLLDLERHIKHNNEQMKFKRLDADMRLNYTAENKRAEREIARMNDAYPDIVEDQFTKQGLVNVINHRLVGIETTLDSNKNPIVILKFDYGH